MLAEFLGLLNNFDFDVKAVYLDSGFYDGKCLTLLRHITLQRQLAGADL